MKLVIRALRILYELAWWLSFPIVVIIALLACINRDFIFAILLLICLALAHILVALGDITKAVYKLINKGSKDE